MFRSIAVPLDGSSFGEHALPLALSIARRAYARLVLLHVSDEQPSAGRAPVTEPPASGYLDTLAGYLSDRWEVQASTVTLAGQVAPALVEWLDNHEADLIVLSTHGRGMLREALLGGVAQGLVRHTTVPVLLVRPHEAPLDLLETVRDQPCARILVPLDRSPAAELILKPACEIARLANAEITLLSVIDATPVMAAGEVPSIRVSQWIDRQHAEAEQYLEEQAARLRAEGLKVHTEVAEGNPAETVLATAAEHAVDMIAMTTHARSGVPRLLMGSVAEAVVRRAGVPVLLSRPLDS